MWHAPNSARNPMLTQPVTARRLSRSLPAGLRMLQALGLNHEEQTWLLGAAQQHGPQLSHTQLTRLSLAVTIYNALHILYDANTAADWLKRPNARPPFGSQTPLEHMRRGGIPAMREAATNVETVIEF